MRSISALLSVAVAAGVAFARIKSSATTQPMQTGDDGDGGNPWLSIEDCGQQGPWTPTQRVGPGTGAPFCDFRWGEGNTHGLITSIDVWWMEDFGIIGLQVHYSDPSNADGTIHGQSPDPNESQFKQTFRLDKDDTVTLLTTWGDGTGSRLGAIKMKTKNGGEFYAGSHRHGDDGHDMDLQSGLLVGIVGHNGAEINNIGFIFLNHAIKSATETNVQYNLPDSPDDKTISGRAPLNWVLGNPAGNSEPITLAVNKKNELSSTTVAQSTIVNTWGEGLSVGFKGSLAGLVEITGTPNVKWDHTTTNMESTAHTQTFTAGIRATITLQPGHGTHCQLTYAYGKGDFDYTSTVQVEFDDGSTYEFAAGGKISAESYANGRGQCTDENDPSKWSTTSAQDIADIRDQDGMTGTFKLQ